MINLQIIESMKFIYFIFILFIIDSEEIRKRTKHDFIPTVNFLSHFLKTFDNIDEREVGKLITKKHISYQELNDKHPEKNYSFKSYFSASNLESFYQSLEPNNVDCDTYYKSYDLRSYSTNRCFNYVNIINKNGKFELVKAGCCKVEICLTTRNFAKRIIHLNQLYDCINFQ